MRQFLLALFAGGILLAILGAGATTAAPVRAEWRELGTYRVTGFCPCARTPRLWCARCCGKSDGMTADGTYAPTWPERIVAAPKGLPFGARLWIEGVGPVTVHDRGRAIKGERLDLFFKTHGEARIWSAQRLRVFVWTEPSAR